MRRALQDFEERSGRYIGVGTNHVDEPYEGRLELLPLLRSAGVQIVASATGEKGTLYHAEHTILAPGADGQLRLFMLGIEMPGMRILEYRRDDALLIGSEASHVFGYGAPTDLDSFRMEIAFDLWPDGDVTHRFAWGLPGEEFADRSGCRLRPRS